jgi:ammonium transporter, Amt family
MRSTNKLINGLALLLMALLTVSALTIAWADDAPPDPNGSATGNAATLAAAKPGEPTLAEVAAEAGHSKVAINMMWTLITGFIVMFMQAGFALVETALCRAKNSAHTMTMNFLIYPLGLLGFYLCGFAFMFGGVGKIGGIATMGGYVGLNNELGFHIGDKFIGLLGWSGFCLSGWTKGPGYDVAVFALFLFQMVFMDTTATIPTGACAERWKFSSFTLYGCFVGSVMYPIFGNWVWGGGWLSQLGNLFGIGHGHIDFAGSSVVHMQGGVIALVFAWMLGPRFGKYNKDGSVNPMPAHNIPMAILGTFILAFCWFSFNAGSSLAGGDLRISVAATNTMLASATAAMATCLYMWWFKTKKPDPSMLCNGMLAGLVAITAPCAFVDSAGACIIGIVSGILVVESVFFFDKRGIDDPVGAISVHGVNGAWGCLSLGLFADGVYGEGWNSTPGKVVGLFYGGGAGQLVAQTIGVVTCFVTLSILSVIVFKIVTVLSGGTQRPTEAIEIEGSDIAEMGVHGYHGFVMDKESETPMPHGHGHAHSPSSSKSTISTH